MIYTVKLFSKIYVHFWSHINENSNYTVITQHYAHITVSVNRLRDGKELQTRNGRKGQIGVIMKRMT